MTEAQALLDHRRHLWMVLAPLWLDREPGERDYQRMIAEIERLELDFRSLERIYRLELAPVLARHQVSMVGGWRHFEEEPLLHALMRHALRLTPWRRRLWWLMSGLTTAMTRHRWHHLIRQLMSHRRTGQHPPE
ncbi:hypothetical protein C7446_0877 [Kushneria sinocarnis]|uniref:DUF7079 domain-containing protein n=1 Tax=Kushneria sinocarnis TaxID=595502 RepID=A0A420WZT3_9GAMM|nr:hypothetical protein [Kushneria sinocarnis]RKR06878.1 hypothetical protein C7446_0877 [Kushneria sinocarnis]